MATRLNAYLNFDNRARDAMEFYQSVLGGELTLVTFAEFNASEDPADADKIMHGYLKMPEGSELMAADTPTGMDNPAQGGFGLALFGEDADELTGYFEALSAGGTISVPLEQAPWGDTFGMVTDRFGVNWMVNIAGPEG